MSALSYTNVITEFFGVIDEITRSYVYNGYSAVANHIRHAVGSAVVLYIMILGYSINQGYVKLSIKTFIYSIIKITAIYYLALNWDFFSEYVVRGICGSAGQAGDWLVAASPVKIGNITSGGINEAIQTVFIEVTRVGVWTWQKGGIKHFEPYFTAILIWLSGYAVVLLSLAEIALSKLAIAILLSVAPIFIAMTLFKSTHGLFDKWLGHLLGFSFFQIFIPAAIAMSLALSQFAIGDQYSAEAANITLIDFVPIMFAGGISVMLTIGVAAYAMSIGGGASTASGNSMLADSVSGALSGGGAAISGMRRMLSGKKGGSDESSDGADMLKDEIQQGE